METPAVRPRRLGLTTLGRFGVVLLLVAVTCFSFAVGVISYRQQAPPYTWVKSLARSVVLPPKEAESVELRAERSLDRLSTLGYLAARPADRPDERGVLTHQQTKTFQGLNFYNETKRSAARLIDMSGDVLHEWNYKHLYGQWHHAELLPDGDVIVVMGRTGIARINLDSELEWFHKARAHHALWVHDDGDIYFLETKSEVLPQIHPTLPVEYDEVVVLGPDGAVRDRFSLLDSMQRSAYAGLQPRVSYWSATGRESTAIDLMHSNQIEVFDGELSHLSPLFGRGNMLVSIRNFNALVILDAESRDVIWAWGPNNLIRQHHPSLLKDGTILVFDNGISQSRVLQLDPTAMTVTWLYENGEQFFSNWGGSCQRLPNGNTLITETDGGRVFEVGRDGEVVWEFVNPEVSLPGERTNVWRMTRFERDELTFVD